MNGRATSTLDPRERAGACPRREVLLSHAGFISSVALLIVACCWWPSPAHAQQDATPTIVELRAGFDGKFKVGCWTQFELTLEGGSRAARGQVQLTVADGDGVPSRVHAPKEIFTLGAGEKKTVTLLAKIGQLTSDVVVSFRADDGPGPTRRYRTAEPGPLAGIASSAAPLIVALGGPLNATDREYLERGASRVAELASFDQLPSEWYGFDSADAVIVATGDEQVSRQLSQDSPRLAALDQWVRMGGTLILSVGRQAERVLASTSPLARFAPGRLETTVPLVASTPLEAYAETSEPIDAGGAQKVRVPRLTDVRGRIEAFAGSGPHDLPLVVRAPHGFGQVVFLAVDLEGPTLANWSARGQLFDKLLGRAHRRATDADGGTLGEVTTLGFVDMAGQLRGALEQFAGVQLVPFWLVALLILIYIACIGPLDYFLVKRLLGRMEATWLTFTLTVVVFCTGAYLLAYELKGRELRANQVDLIDFDAESQLVRGTTWATLFSPTSRAYDLSVDSAPAVAAAHGAVDIVERRDNSNAADAVPVSDSDPAPRAVFSWMGLPGDGFGGMNATTAGLPLFTVAYDFSSALNRMERVPIAVWSTKAFIGRWSARAAGPIEADLADNGRLVGTLACHLDAPLTDCVLIYDTWAYPLHTLEPGQRIDIESQLDPQTVETYLRRVTVRGDRDVSPPYNRASFEIPRIVEVMGCHELAGGESYTGLSNEYQAFTDLSQLVRNGRAILVGRRAASATRLVCDGGQLEDPNSQRWTFYRFVFPVKDRPRP